MGDAILRRSVLALGLGLSALPAFGSGAAHAAGLGMTATLPSCDGGASTDCVDAAELSHTPVNANSAFIGSPVVDGAVATFTTAFDAWDAAYGNAWRLVDGGSLDLTITPTIGASASNATGGLSPVIFTLSGGSASLLSQLVWTQALVINYSPLGGAVSTPIQTLDTFELSQNAAGDNPNFPRTCSTPSAGASPANGAFCGPIYPFQYGSTVSSDVVDGVRLGVDPFYDAPQGLWPDASFKAITLLSEVNAATDTLTVYQGIAYGFSLSATGSGQSSSAARTADPIPEPPTWALALGGFAALALAGCAAKRRAAAA